MNYRQAEEIINSAKKFGSKPELERIEKLLKIIDNPQDQLKCVHIAGTNGKGSVSFSLASVLKSAGYKVGLFTSPEISDWREKIQINGEKISKSKVCELLDFFKPILESKDFEEDKITEFELITAMAFKFFKDEQCDIAVIETGMGGKWDATNVLKKPICSIITSISKDHTKFLGDTLEQIAEEKCGIIKPHCPVILAENQPQEVQAIAKSIAKIRESEIIIANISCVKNVTCNIENGMQFDYKNLHINTNLMGKHQIKNLTCVLTALEVIKKDFKIPNKSVVEGLSQVAIPCRLEIVNRNPIVILDGAHNPAGAETLSDFIKNHLKGKKIIGIMGMFKDKDFETVCATVAPLLNKIYAVQSNSQRALELSKMRGCVAKYNKNVEEKKVIKEALQTALQEYSSNNDVVIVFGSFSIMAEAKNFFDTLSKNT